VREALFPRRFDVMDVELKIGPGKTLDARFHVLEEIGRGGMAVVFKALDMDNAGRFVAVKVPRPQYSSGLGSVSMFQREAEIGARLDHPSILKFVDVAPRKGARNYLVTEYVAGPTLASRIGAGRRMAEADALRLMSRICEAVEYLHRQGFVHYDLKPSNVLLADDGSIRLIDLGLAHAIEKRRFALVASAPPVATSQYVAPEQIGRRRGQPSVDIYGLGAMLYEMLTGHSPWEGDDPFVVGSARQVGDPRAPRELCSEISEQAEEVVLRALRRRPAERYPTVSALRADLDDVRAVRVSGLAHHLVPVTRARRWLRILRFAAAAALGPIVSMTVMFFFLWWWLARGR
jgi:serine/threonine-protein kinase